MFIKWGVHVNKEKEKAAIQRLQTFAPQNGDSYYLCYSGGKDSDAIRILAALANVPHEIYHNLTTVDAPETVQYIKTIPGVIIDKARYTDGTPKTMWNLIPKKKLPPTRLMRWCCAELKEWGGRGRLRVTGIRWDESCNRRMNGDVVKIIGKEKTTQKKLEDLGLPYTVTPQGGIKMSLDNEMARDQNDFLQQCYRDRSVTVNPIVDWTDKDVWEFLHFYGCESNPLYQCGEIRIGCIGCPLSGPRQQKADFKRYPKYALNYIKAFDRMLKARKEARLENKIDWQSGIGVMKWWLGDNIDQLTFFDDDEIYNALTEE